MDTAQQKSEAAREFPIVSRAHRQISLSLSLSLPLSLHSPLLISTSLLFSFTFFHPGILAERLCMKLA